MPTHHFLEKSPPDNAPVPAAGDKQQLARLEVGRLRSFPGARSVAKPRHTSYVTLRISHLSPVHTLKYLSITVRIVIRRHTSVRLVRYQQHLHTQIGTMNVSSSNCDNAVCPSSSCRG